VWKCVSFLRQLTGNLLYVSFDRNQGTHIGQCTYIYLGQCYLSAWLAALCGPLLKIVQFGRTYSHPLRSRLMHTICFVYPFYGAGSALGPENINNFSMGVLWSKRVEVSSKGKPEKKQEQGNNYLEDRNFNFHSNQLAEWQRQLSWLTWMRQESCSVCNMLLPCCGFECLASWLLPLLLIMHGLQGNKPRWCWHTARKGSALLCAALNLNLEMKMEMEMEMQTETEMEMQPRSRWSSSQLSHGRLEIPARSSRHNCCHVCHYAERKYWN